MATIEQDTRRLSREIRDMWRIRNHFFAEISDRSSNSNFWGEGEQRNLIRQYYVTMRFYLTAFEDQYREVYRRMRRWSRDYAAIPDEFENNLGPQVIQIKRPMATTNRLAPAQLNATITPEPFDNTGNRYENLWDVVDSFNDYLICLSLRSGGWSVIWDARGSQPRFNRIVAILEDLQAICRFGSSLLEDIAESINVDKGAGVDELELRQNYSQRRQVLGTPDGEGGLYALNRGLTTAELGGNREPVEYVPDIETLRDFPVLGVDVP